MKLTSSMISCGVYQLHGLAPQEYGKQLKEVYNTLKLYGVWPAILVFSDATFLGYGESLAKSITDAKLGTLAESPIVRNPSSGNNIQCWVWTLPSQFEFRNAIQ